VRADLAVPDRLLHQLGRILQRLVLQVALEEPAGHRCDGGIGAAADLADQRVGLLRVVAEALQQRMDDVFAKQVRLDLGGTAQTVAG
jgi:hypothetical protein